MLPAIDGSVPGLGDRDYYLYLKPNDAQRCLIVRLVSTERERFARAVLQLAEEMRFAVLGRRGRQAFFETNAAARRLYVRIFDSLT